MLTRSTLQALVVALVVIAMGAIPVLYAIKGLRTTQAAVVQSRSYEKVLEATFDMRLKVEKHVLYFVATALDLDNHEREKMLVKADAYLNQFREAVAQLGTGASGQVFAKEHESLHSGLRELSHNWEEITRDGQLDMATAEKTWHYLVMVENFEKLNDVLVGIHRRVSSEHANRNREMFSGIEVAILTIVILTITGTGLASAGLGGSSYLLSRSRAQAVQLRDNNELLNQRKDALRIQSGRFRSAIQNMAQGLCMIDKDHKLITWNDKFAVMYGIPGSLLQVGLPYLNVLEHRFLTGSIPGSCSDFFRQELGTLERAESHYEIYELPDGRFISTSFEPIPEGGMLTTHLDVTNSRKSEMQIMHLANHDGLTSLLNRRYFVERLEKLLDELQADDGVALFAIDLDDFKLANDKFGHGAGDLILATVAIRLKACAGECDLISRIGGDEFSIVVTGMKCREAAEKFASKLVSDLSKPYDCDGQHIEIGASVGIALAPNDARDINGLMKVADLALYAAKNKGRNRSCMFSPNMLVEMIKRRELEEQLAEALECGQMELYYQPLICAHSGLVNSMEALLRWNHPSRGVLSPFHFITVAEKMGLMGALGTWVINRACADAVQWPSSVGVAVNVSAAQFHMRALELDVAAALGNSGLPGNRLEIEITESLLLSDEDAVLETIHKIHDLGVSIAMDDFGTGYSSLSYLHKYPLDKIKIDRSFITDLPDSNHSLSIVRTIISLARSMGMSIAAEGVETDEQMALLKDEGCHQLQGYRISRPIPADHAGDLFLQLKPPQSKTLTFMPPRNYQSA